MPLKRTTHWATRGLHQFLLRQRHVPFAWGTNDCCLFAANAIESFTGVDIASDFRGVAPAPGQPARPAYADLASALALVEKVTGGKTVEAAAAWCAAKHGLEEWGAPLLAQRGDLVLVENGGRQIAGIVHLTGRHVVSVAESGLVKLFISPNAMASAIPGYTTILRAWRV